MTTLATIGLSKERKDALLMLLDDPSPSVREASDEPVSGAAREWLSKLAGEDPQDSFVSFINSFQYELETGSLMLDRTIFTDLDTAAYYNFMESVAKRCRELMLYPSTVHERCKVINRVLFHEYGFRADSDDLLSPLNSYLHQVVKRRKGLPITLSILYILIAERCNIQLEPISLPGYFMVGCFQDRSPFFIDPYGHGVMRSLPQLGEYLTKRNIHPQEKYFHPSPVGEVICRTCRNLANQYAHEKDIDRSEMFSGFVKTFHAAYRKHARP